jgi:hypothetical protein
MNHLLVLVGAVAGLLAGMGFYVALFNHGNDIQWIAAGIYSMVSVTSLGLAEIIHILKQRLQSPSADTPEPRPQSLHP